MPFATGPSTKYGREKNENAVVLPCFLTADYRGNEQLGLTILHTLWFRKHNCIARELLKMNSCWLGDIVDKHVRKTDCVGMQLIAFSHWLPKIFGKCGMKLRGNYKGYNPYLKNGNYSYICNSCF